MKKRFPILIDEEIYWVYDIPEKKHQALNGGPEDYWIYFHKGPFSNGLEPDINSTNWIPFEWKTAKRFIAEINIKENQTSKYKYNSISLRNGITVTITMNRELFYEFRCRDLSFAMAKAQTRIIEMGEHPYNFYRPNEESGRKIYWRGLPAMIEPKINSPWEILVYPAFTDDIPDKDTWFNKYNQIILATADTEEKVQEISETILEIQQQGFINWGDAFSDGYINWFRS